MMGWSGIRRSSSLSKIGVDEHLVGVDQQIVRIENNLVLFSAPKRSLREFAGRVEDHHAIEPSAAAPAAP